MKRISLVFLSALFLNTTAAVAEPLTVCGVEWLPFTKADGQNIVGGISYEIHTEIFKRLKVEVAFKNVPWNRCVSGVETGLFAAVSDASARDDLISGPMPISFYPVALYMRAEGAKKDFTITEYSSVSVGAVQGYALPAEITEKARWKLDLAPDEETAMKKLQAKRYDYYVGDTIATAGLAEKLGFKVAALEPLLYSDKLYLVFGKKHDKLAADYYAELAKLKSEGFIDKLYLQAFAKTYDQMAR